MRRSKDITAAQTAADAASGELEHYELLMSAGVAYDEASFLAGQVAADYYSMLSEQLITEAPGWHERIKLQLQASWLAGCVVGGKLEEVSPDEPVLGYDDLHEASEVVRTKDNPLPSPEVLAALDLHFQDTMDAASIMGIDVVVILVSADGYPQLSEDDEINCSEAFAGTWMAGLIACVQARRRERAS